MPRIANLLFGGVASCVTAMVLVAVWQPAMRADPHTRRAESRQSAQLTDAPERLSPAANDETMEVGKRSGSPHPIIIRKPSGPPRIELAGTDPQGRSGSVACSTCHGIREANLTNRSAATLDEFHQGMAFSHGSIACYSCHNPKDADALRLADGSTVAFQNVMTLCSQCHSKQAESYAHGAHGGMNGHWDLSRGPQMKNNCIDCHDPHAPNYPKMIVGFKPRDRFNEPSSVDHAHEGAASHDDH